MFDLLAALIGAIAVILVIWTGVRSLAVIAVASWVQNIIVPWAYTKGWVSATTALALISLKDLVLALLLLIVATHVGKQRVAELPMPIKATLAYGGYALLRSLVGATLLGEDLFANLRLLRGLLFPVQAILAGYLAGLTLPRFAVRYRRVLTATLGSCAVVSLVLFFAASDRFWMENVNIAQFNVDVKGDDPTGVLLDQGVSGSAAARDSFLMLSRFRLFGTFGDPLTAGLSLALGLVLLLGRRRPHAGELTAAGVMSAAIFLTFSRSSWILVAVALFYIYATQRRFGALLAAAATIAVCWLAMAGLRDFVTQSLASLAGISGDVEHARGVRGIYSTAVLNAGNLVGRGPGERSIPENGLAFLLEQYGVLALGTFVAMCLTAERFLRRSSDETKHITTVGAALAVGTLVVAHFAEYALSFTAYFGIWSIIGLAIGSADRAQREQALDSQHLATP
jgi:hypothetical protein